jgi:hypothetical protein
MAATELARIRLPTTGDQVVTPPLAEMDRFEYRVILEGVLRFAYTDEEFDALYRAGPNGPFTEPHRYLRWSFGTPELENEDVVRHRYVFRIPASLGLEEGSVGVRVDVDRLVDQYLIPPSEVRRGISGDMTVTVLRTALAPPSPWPYLVGASAPAALLVGGVAWAIRRRRMYGGLSTDLQAALARIEAKHRAAVAAVGRQSGQLFPFSERLGAVRSGALGLARRLQEIRETRQLMEPHALETEIARLEEQLSRLTDDRARREGEIALREKRRALDLLAEVERAEARCAMRLGKIEAILETATLTLRARRPPPTPSAWVPGPATPAEDALLRELDAEVAAIDEVARGFTETPRGPEVSGTDRVGTSEAEDC